MDIPLSSADRDSLANIQHMAAFDLITLALAFALLHEFQHVMFCADRCAPSTRPEEEIACDTYARTFMTSEVATYAKAHGYHFA